MKKVVKRLFKKIFNVIEPGDLVRIKSNCENTRKPIYKVYAHVKKEGVSKYRLAYTYGQNTILAWHEHWFNKEELELV